jgi:hypothetical protein
MKKIIITVCIILLFCSTSYAWLSQDPNVFQPLYGTAWEFHHNNRIDNIGFYTEAITDSNGNAVLPALNLDTKAIGILEYGSYPIPTGGTGFICMIPEGDQLTNFQWYFFNTSNSVASGQYLYYSLLNPDYIQYYPLMGYKIYNTQDDQNQPIYFDQNQLIEIDQNQIIQIDQNQIETDQNQIQAIPDIQGDNDSNSDSGEGCFLLSLRSHLRPSR